VKRWHAWTRCGASRRLRIMPGARRHISQAVARSARRPCTLTAMHITSHGTKPGHGRPHLRFRFHNGAGAPQTSRRANDQLFGFHDKEKHKASKEESRPNLKRHGFRLEEMLERRGAYVKRICNTTIAPMPRGKFRLPRCALTDSEESSR
jgi:hypothetical protein